MADISPRRNRRVNGRVRDPLSRLLPELFRELGHFGAASELASGIVPGDEPLPAVTDRARVDEFAIRYLRAEILSKYDDGKSSETKFQACLARFREAEDLCSSTNERFRNRDYSGSTNRRSVRSILSAASVKIAKLLGPLDWDEAYVHFGHGPGASTRLPRRRSDMVHKYSGKPETTLGNAALALACIKSVPLWEESALSGGGDLPFDIVAGNRIISVPKNYKTDRMIAIEPCMNIYVQKGLGGVIRKRLKRVGVDLDDQSKNQRLARVGSIAGSLATVDLSMASDTISYEVVKALLPPDWVEALEQCRSPVGVLPSGEIITYQKWSSMGNGYTFELESLIFWGLISAVLDAYGIPDRRCAVYGDDLVVPTQSLAPVLQILEYCGFKPNSKKTHSTGPFRESCGKHYFHGVDVSPFYVRRPVTDLVELFLFHNNLVRWILRRDSYLSWVPFLSRIRALAPANWRRPRIPDGVGDGAFIGTFDEATPRAAGRGFEGYRCTVLLAKSETTSSESVGQLIKSLYLLEGKPLRKDFRKKGSLSPASVSSLRQARGVRVGNILVPRFPAYF